MSPADKLPLATNPVPELSAADAARVLADAAMRAGALARTMREKGLKTWIKGKDSPVSDADIAADKLLREILSAAAPDYEWLSEESADIAGRAAHRRRWVVDPIDGTRAFIKGQPDWSISAALTEDGRPIAAALYAPATDELFSAWAGGGVTRNGKAIAVSPRAALDGARVAGPKFMLERLETTGAGIEAVPRIHSLALRFARAAAGEIDAAFASENSHDWDLAAADLLVHEAGGALTGPDGGKIVYGDPDAAHPALAAAGPALLPAALTALGKVLARDSTGSTSGSAPTVARPHTTTRRNEGGNMSQPADNAPQKQLLHLVFGGELVSLDGTQFRDLDNLDIVGVFPNYASAYTAWKAKAQQTVDNAHMRYFIVHLHRLLDPETDSTKRQR